MTEQTTALTVVERAVVALKFDEKKEQELRELAARTADITTITNADGRAQVHAARMVLKNQRLQLKEDAETAREDATKYSRAVIALEKRAIAIISGEEDRLQAIQDAWDDAIEADKQAKIAAEQTRVADIQRRIEAIREFPDGLSMRPAAEVQKKLEEAEAFPIDETFEEFAESARSVLANTLLALKNIHYDRVQHEAEQARIKAEREELANLRAEQAERDRLAAIERKALADKQAQEAAAERARIAEEERQAKDARDAEAAKQAEELRLMRFAQQQAADAERKRIADEEANAKAVRDAETKKLAEERAAFDRQQAAARKVKEEEERAKREQARVASLKKPADAELLGVLASHYSAPTSKVIEWILAMDLSQTEAA